MVLFVAGTDAMATGKRLQRSGHLIFAERKGKGFFLWLT